MRIHLTQSLTMNQVRTVVPNCKFWSLVYDLEKMRFEDVSLEKMSFGKFCFRKNLVLRKRVLLLTHLASKELKKRSLKTSKDPLCAEELKS